MTQYHPDGLQARELERYSVLNRRIIEAELAEAI
jgi:hypothetical protein